MADTKAGRVPLGNRAPRVTAVTQPVNSFDSALIRFEAGLKRTGHRSDLPPMPSFPTIPHST